MNYTEVSLEKLREISIEVAKEINSEYKVDLIIYVAKAGLPIAIYMNEVFDATVIGIRAQRKGNRLKLMIAPIVALFPRFVRDVLITIELKSKVHKNDTERNVLFHKVINELNISKYKKILIVDDSVDTGNSMQLVYKTVREKFVDSDIKTFSLNVWDASKNVFKIDYFFYENTVIKSPMSKDSKEYQTFIKLYNEEVKKECM